MGTLAVMRKIGPWFGLGDVPDAAKTVVVLGCPFGSSDTFRSGANRARRRSANGPVPPRR